MLDLLLIQVNGMGDLFNNTGNTSGGDSNYQSQTESRSESQYSQRTMASMRDTQESFHSTQTKMIDDLARSSGNNPQQMLESMMEIKQQQARFQKLSATIEKSTSDKFTSLDHSDMRERRNKGQTDAQIAKSYATNTTYINRSINGK